MDEKLLVAEQERFIRTEKKKKRHKREKIAAVVILALAVVAVGIVCVVRAVRGTDSSEETVRIVTSAGQTVVYGELTSVQGNEITYRVAREAESGGQEGERLEMPEMGEQPEGQRGERPQMPEQGERPGLPEVGEFPGMETRSGGNAADGFTYDNTTYELTDETVTVQIPVGTTVTTRLGTETTFSRLAAGDRVALVMEEDGDGQVIAAVYIIG